MEYDLPVREQIQHLTTEEKDKLLFEQLLAEHRLIVEFFTNNGTCITILNQVTPEMVRETSETWRKVMDVDRHVLHYDLRNCE